MIRKYFSFLLISFFFFTLPAGLFFADQKKVSSESSFKGKPRFVFNRILSKTDKQVIFLNLPSGNRVLSSKKTYTFQGRNRSKHPVFYNGKLIPEKKSGYFAFSIPLNQTEFWGYFSFIPSENQVHTLLIPFRHLMPLDEGVSLNLRKKYTLFFNSDLLYNPEYKRKQDSTLTRADLAYFIAHLLSPKESLKNGMNTKDVSTSSPYAASISYVLSKNLMPDFPDATFRPDDAVSRLEVAMALSKVFSLPLAAVSDNWPYKDVNKAHWSAKQVEAALQHSLLVATPPYFKPDQSLTVLEFSAGVISQAIVQDYLKAFEELELSITADMKLATLYAEALLAETLKEKVLIQPTENIEKSLEKKIALERPVFKDLNGHWIQDSISKFRKQGLIAEEEYFSPNKRVNRKDVLKCFRDMNLLPTSNQYPVFSGSPEAELSRAEALVMIVKLLGLSLIENGALYQDLSQKHWAYPYLFAAQREGLLSKGRYFNPIKKITKSELYAILSKIPAIKSKLDANPSLLSK